MDDKLILTFDFGTQSVRTALINKKGEIVDIIKEHYNPPYFSTKPGYAEQDPNYYYQTLCSLTKKLVNKNPQLINNILGITMCFFRDSVVALDKDNNLLRPAILWLDERRAQGLYKLPVLSRALFKTVGAWETIELNQNRSMSQWLHENEPEIWEKTDKFMFISTYITMLLTGEYKDCPSCQAGHLPINFKKGTWRSKHDIMGQVFDVPKRMLCELSKQGEILGHLSKKAAEDTGLPEGMTIFAGGSDKSAETLGLGCIDKYTAAVSYGTACTVEVTTNKFQNAEPLLPSYPAIQKGCYNMDVQVYRGCWTLNWFAKEFSKDEKGNPEKLSNLDKKVMEIEPGCNGLVVQPYWGSGLRRPIARGAMIGFSENTTSAHVYRAIIEGISFCLREGLEFFEKKRLHHKVDKIRISGGGSDSDIICQITADIFGKPVQKVQTSECSSLGCAMAGFIAAKEFKTVEEAVESMVHQTVEFQPNLDNHMKYNYLYNNVYLKMYSNLKKTYKKIKEFCK